MSEVKFVEGQECLWDETYVKESDYRAALAREAKLREELESLKDRRCAARLEKDELRKSLTIAEQRNAEREELLLRCMHAFNHVVGFSDRATRSAWYENFLKPVSGAILLHLAKTKPEPPAKPTESGASHE